MRYGYNSYFSKKELKERTGAGMLDCKKKHWNLMSGI